MNNKQTITIGAAQNGFVLSPNKDSTPVETSELHVFTDMQKLIEFLTDHFNDPQNHGPE